MCVRTRMRAHTELYMYLCIENLREGICQNITSDYHWVLDFTGDFILFFFFF